MNVVGFDVSKDILVGARIDRSGVVKERWELLNTSTAVLPVLKQLRAKYKHLVVASEATGEYHRPLASSCLEFGINFRLLNPLTVKQYVRSTVRKRKTDMTDAEAIARVALQGQGVTLTKESLGITKPILRTSISLMEMSQMCVLMQQHIQSIAPEEISLQAELAECRERLKQAAGVYRSYASEHTNGKNKDLLVSIPG